jgi:hypothetical protein
VVYVETEKKRTATPGRNVKTTHEQTRQMRQMIDFC